MLRKEFLKLELRKPIVYSFILALSIWGAYEYTTTTIESIKNETDLKIKIQNLDTELQKSQHDNEILTLVLEEKNNELNEKKNENESLEDAISDKERSIRKLKETDKELLQKYSKVFFLNEHSVPREITEIDSEYIPTKDKKVEIHGDVWPFLERLLKKAKKDGLDLKITSGYRSFEEQQKLKSGYKVVFGAGTANQFSADQGYSEHQLGTTVDFTTSRLLGAVDAFADTPEYKWLKENAHRYGFILSYPPNNKYYVYEPWHWRFVGEELAEDLFDDNKYFYDLDQRAIDEYQENLFQ